MRRLMWALGLGLQAASPVVSYAASGGTCQDKLSGALLETPEGRRLIDSLTKSKPSRAGKTSAAKPALGYDFLGEPSPGPFAAVMEEVFQAVDRVLGLDVKCLKVVILTSDELERRYRRRGRRIAPGTELGGFHRPGLATNRTVFVRDEGGVVHAIVLAHEVMHAMSQRFSAEADRRHFRALPEGLAQLFALATIPDKDGTDTRWRYVYTGAVEVSRALQDLVGPDVLAASYFLDGIDLLERAVDAKRGAGTFVRAMSALEKGFVRLSLSMLQ